MEKNKILIVLGNGFDLDLNLPTRYEQFIQSDYFKKAELFCGKIIEEYVTDEEMNIPIRYENLFQYLSARKKYANWIDIERELLRLAQREVVNNRGEFVKAVSTGDEERAFNLLSSKLCDYLDSLDYAVINKESSAYNLLKTLNKVNAQIEILTFNYTDLFKIDVMKSLSNHVIIDHVHGCIRNRDIILGFQDKADIHKSYSYMIKSFSPYFKSHNINSKLEEADEVIFFGHSLGTTDYHYFEHFFTMQSDLQYIKRSKIIRIFTYDYQSQVDLLFQLRHMNNKRTDLLYDLNDFEVFRTKDNKDRICSYLQELSRRYRPDSNHIKVSLGKF